MQVGEDIAPYIAAASEKMVTALLNERKILICGHGISAALAQVFASSLLDRYEKERPGLPAVWLGSDIATYTAIAADSGHTDIFAKPLRALGQEGDVLTVISTSGNSSSLLNAISVAHDRGISVVALTGCDGGDIGSLLDGNDIEIRVALNSRGRIHEVHLLSIFCLCDLIDHQLFGIE